jgi:hypothetical protein
MISGAELIWVFPRKTMSTESANTAEAIIDSAIF